MLELHDKKRELARGVLQGDESTAGLDVRELLAMLGDASGASTEPSRPRGRQAAKRAAGEPSESRAGR